MYIYYNPNPLKLSVGDCTIRAISKVTYQTWEDTYLDLIHQGLTMYDAVRNAISDAISKMNK